MLENDEELFERGFQEFAKLFSLIGCSRLFQAMMMMMENYEELYERCFQVTYFTPVKCGIFKTTELIELSLSKANNIFLQKRGYQRPKNKPNRTCSDRQ